MTKSLAERFAKTTKLKGSGFLSQKLSEEDRSYDTNIPALNLAYSGWINKGFTSGISTIAGKSKSFKTLFGLVSCKAYLDAEPDSFMIFYDSEGGASAEYFESVGIDVNRVIYIPVMNIEELKFDMVGKLDEVKKLYEEKGEYSKFIWMIDSLGNLASNKEVQDALDSKSVADMTRAKAMKSLFRIVTPYFKNYKMKLIPIMHTYDEIGGMGAPKQIVSGGTGSIYAADEIFVVGKRQIKEGTDLVGWQFIINIEKSRSIREKSAIPFEVTYDGGIDKYSGLLDIACVTGHVTKPKMGWYTRESVEGDKNWRKKETSSEEFWSPLLSDESFIQAVHNLYAVSGGNTILQSKLDEVLTIDQETGEVLSEVDQEDS